MTPKLGLISTSRMIPLWLVDQLKIIQQQQVASVCTLIYVRQRRQLVNLLHLWLNHPFLHLYVLVDACIYAVVFRKKRGAQTRVDILKEIPELSVIEIIGHGREVNIPEAVAIDIRSEELECILNVSNLIPDARTRQLARLGIWSFRSILKALPIPFLQELLETRSYTGSELVMVGIEGTRRILATMLSHTFPYSLKKNTEHHLSLSACLLKQQLLIAKNNPNYEFEQPQCADQSDSKSTGPLGLLFRWPTKITHELTRPEQWSLAYSFSQLSQLELDIAEFNILPMPEGVFWGDPFPVSHKGRKFVFFEQYHYAERNASLMVAELGVEGFREPARPIIERNGVISYPFVFQWEGQWYLLPETSAEGIVQLYRATDFPYVWTKDRVLLENVNACDATIIEYEDRWWMFVAIAPIGVENWDQTYLFYSNSPLGSWVEHPMNPIVSDTRRARPAGRLFNDENVLYRPAQDCSLSYGCALAINRVEELNTHIYRETWVKTYGPISGYDGIHTINRCEGLLMVDCKRSIRRFTPYMP